MTLFSTRLFQCRQFPAALIAHRQGRGERSGRGSGEVPSSNNCAMRSPCLPVSIHGCGSAEPGGGHIEGDPHPQVKAELGETKMELQDAKGKLSQASREASRVAREFPQQIDHVKSCTNYDPPSAVEVDQCCRQNEANYIQWFTDWYHNLVYIIP